VSRFEGAEGVGRLLAARAWWWNALYPILVAVGGAAVLALWLPEEGPGLAVLGLIPLFLGLAACGALTYLTLGVDALHLRKHGGWAVPWWRYAGLGLGTGALTFVLPFGAGIRDMWLFYFGLPAFVFVTAGWNLWYAGRRYQYAAP
jgi:hypothetical protein